MFSVSGSWNVLGLWWLICFVQWLNYKNAKSRHHVQYRIDAWCFDDVDVCFVCLSNVYYRYGNVSGGCKFV